MTDLSKFPWWSLFDAYGPAVRVPEFVRDLCAEDEDIWLEAVNTGLWSHMFHQYSVYSVTPYAIPFVAGTLKCAQPECRYQIMEFLKACAGSENRLVIPSPIFWIIRILKHIKKQTIKTAIRGCKGNIEPFTINKDWRVKNLAIWLIDYCNRN